MDRTTSLRVESLEDRLTPAFYGSFASFSYSWAPTDPCRVWGGSFNYSWAPTDPCYTGYGVYVGW